MQIFIKTLSGKNITLDVDAQSTIISLKEKIQHREGVPSDEQRLVYAGKQLEDTLTLAEGDVISLATLHLSLSLEGGAKKRKKKQYTKPKKLKHKRKKVKMMVLKYYKVDENNNVVRLRDECKNIKCQAATFLARHKDRSYCGKCHAMKFTAPRPQ